MTHTTVRHLAAGEALTRPLSDVEFKTLNLVQLVAPCHSCTAMLDIQGDVVYHPKAGALDQVTDALDLRKRN